jgi:16S rRNA (guanine966-N2)-methyltransferase
LRIIAGRYRGRRLVAPAGLTTRPTGDRVREALFSILEHGEPALRGSRFLDLFAGSGAVGLEALSRGAAAVLLVESEPQAARAIERNIASLDAAPHVRLLRQDASRLGRAGEAFDIAYLDPPYRAGLLVPALAGLMAGGWLAPEARLVCETAREDEPGLPASFTIEDERRYGAARLLFLRYNGGFR